MILEEIPKSMKIEFFHPLQMTGIGRYKAPAHCSIDRLAMFNILSLEQYLKKYIVLSSKIHVLWCEICYASCDNIRV